MDYAEQRTFLAAQKRRLWPAGAGCALLIAAASTGGSLFWVPLLAAILSAGLFAAAHYLPNYLCLSADASRRLRWWLRAHEIWLVFSGILLWLHPGSHALIIFAFALLPELLLDRERFREGLPQDPIAATGKRVIGLGFTCALLETAMLWQAARDAPASGVLWVVCLLPFGFLHGVLLRPASLEAQGLAAISAGALGYFLSGSWLASAGALLWLATALNLLERADEQNRRNYRKLVEELTAFSGKSEAEVGELLRTATRRLAEDWQRTQPRAPDAVTAWYSRNAHLYLYDIAQHHLLYRHMLFTFAVLRLARGRVLDFGGGNGDLSCALAQAGLETTYFDVPGDSANFTRWCAAREELRLEMINDPAQLRPGFDTIIALDVLEHVADVKPVLALWQQLLAPGGRLAATVYWGPASSAPMHLDPGFDVRAHLLAAGFRDVKQQLIPFGAPAGVRRANFLVLEKPTGQS